MDEMAEAPGRLRTDGLRAWGALLIWLTAGATAVWLGAPPPALPESAPAEVASGGRARALLERIAKEEGGGAPQPRPVGTPANARCRERILEEWRRMGFTPEVSERVTVVGNWSLAGSTKNILVRLQGTGRREGPGTAILCMAHYDSVGAGPGIGDDLSGVAALLEVARALKAQGGTARDVIFLIDDAEESGLLGAKAFEQHHPWAAEVGAVINLEARGTSGQSRMFETGPGNADIVGALAGIATRPSASSVSVEVYRRMPNDTDFSIWRRRGVSGLNFAFIGDVSRYHTPIDDLEHLDPRSLQHHVTNAVEAVLALDQAPLLATPSEPKAQGAALAEGEAGVPAPADAVFLDLGGRSLVTMAIPTIRSLAGLFFLLALVGIARALSRGALGLKGTTLALLGVPVAIGVALFVADLHLDLLRALGASAATFSAATDLTAVSVGAIGLGVLFALALGLTRVMTSAECGAAVALLVTLVGMLLTWTAPGAAYLVVFPSAVLAVTWFIFPRKGDLGARVSNAALFAVGIAAFLWMPLYLGLVDAFGAGSGTVLLGPLLVCALLLLAPVCRAASGASPWVIAVLLATGLGSGALATRAPAFTPDQPGRLNLVYVQTAGGEACWLARGFGAGTMDAEVRTELMSSLGGAILKPPFVPIPWAGWTTFSLSTSPIKVAFPELQVVDHRPSEEGCTLRLRMRTSRGGDELLLNAEGLSAMRAGGVTVSPRGLSWLAPGDGWVEFEVDLAGDLAASITVYDKRFGLGRALTQRAEMFLTEREPLLVPSDDGDGSVLKAEYELKVDAETSEVVLQMKGEDTATAAGGGGR